MMLAGPVDCLAIVLLVIVVQYLHLGQTLETSTRAGPKL
jgi:hypothetical protein